MPIEQTRIEAAARAMMVDPKLWDISTESYRDEWRGRALDVLAAAFPELASDPPTGWVAPRHMTDVMIEAVEARVSHMDTASDELVNFDFAQADRFWRAARDAHTKEQT